ncbi:MAG: membrane integrity-associated transporter subunit PqiC [Paraburkholderia sp.]|uniref:PqiC family protein n=1 Tax=Paraburkholderia sp. TaxID=1926495 RepID=UPI00120F7D71|nr:PqiC family protein [Paraburkholderia sp.]TAL99056.1 MAG: membrane integrity-associated transporter subunit PqiC [Paraburkholderia sp.]
MNRSTLLSFTMIALGLLAGCATSPASKFYTLSPVQIAEPSKAVDRVVIAFDPVSVPELVDRPQIVSRLGANRVSIDEFARWAEPLKSQIPRVLAADLAQLIPGAIVSTYPQRTDESAYRVSVDVQNFDSSMDGTAMLVAIWSVRPPKQGEKVSGRSVVSGTATGPGYDALANAYSRALASVASDIATATHSAMRQ